MLESILKSIAKIKSKDQIDLIKYDDDLLKDSHLDSMEVTELILDLEEMYNFNYEDFENKYKFLSINNLANFFNEKIDFENDFLEKIRLNLSKDITFIQNHNSSIF